MVLGIIHYLTFQMILSDSFMVFSTIVYKITDCSTACVDGTTYESVACAAGSDRTCSGELHH